MGFDLVAPQHVHGPGCGHTAAQVEADAKPKAAVKTAAPVASEARTAPERSQFKMAEQAGPRQDSQNSNPLEQKSAFLGAAVQRFASTVPLAQKTEQPAQPQHHVAAQMLPQQVKMQPQAQAAQSQTPQSTQQTHSQVRESPQTSAAKTVNPAPQGSQVSQGQVVVQGQTMVQGQAKPQLQQPQAPLSAQHPQPSSSGQSQQVTQLPTQVAVSQVFTKQMTPIATPAALQSSQTVLMTQLSQTLTVQLFVSPKAATPVMTGMLQTILKNTASPATLGFDGKEFAAMVMSFMTRERVERRKKIRRKLIESRVVLAVEDPERDRTL